MALNHSVARLDGPTIVDQIQVRTAEESDLAACKRIADQHKQSLGFLSKGVFTDAVRRSHLLVADVADLGVSGFVRFNHRVQGIDTILYDLAVEQSNHGRGIGRALVFALAASSRAAGRERILLKCPDGLRANQFYEHIGFVRLASEPGKKRRLNVWALRVDEKSPCSS